MTTKWTKVLSFLFVSLLVTGCNQQGESVEPNDQPAEEVSTDEAQEVMARNVALAKLKNANDENVGEVSFRKENGLVLIEANMDGLEPGYHGFHIHEKGICEADAPAGPFTTAGGHYNPEGKKHADHVGDMPPLYVNDDGTAYYVAQFDRFDPKQLLEDEVAIMVHEKPDNFANIPERYQSNQQNEPGPDEETLRTGDAGDRQACGVITTVASR